MTQLTHIDPNNLLPKMVDISAKVPSERYALARALVVFPESTADLMVGGEIHTKKGPVIATAIVAGTMGAKKTSELIPFCHQISLTSCQISVAVLDDKTLEIRCEAKTFGTTGVEMEALTGAMTAAATVYDMCKALSHQIVIGPVELLEKTGGKSRYHKP